MNTAISLALSGLGQGIAGINFKKTSFSDNLPNFLKLEGGNKKEKSQEDKKFKSNMFTKDFNIPLDGIEKALLRTIAGLLILFIVFSSFSAMIKKQMEEKNVEIQASIKNTESQMEIVEKDIQKVREKTNEYIAKIKELEEINRKREENLRTKKAIPILLNRLMYIMPTQDRTARRRSIRSRSISPSRAPIWTAWPRVSRSRTARSMPTRSRT